VGWGGGVVRCNLASTGTGSVSNPGFNWLNPLWTPVPGVLRLQQSTPHPVSDDGDCRNGANWRSATHRQPPRKRLVPCSGGPVNSGDVRLVPEAYVYLADRTREDNGRS
jgi:hypothetical protein